MQILFRSFLFLLFVCLFVFVAGIFWLRSICFFNNAHHSHHHHLQAEAMTCDNTFIFCVNGLENVDQIEIIWLKLIIFKIWDLDALFIFPFTSPRLLRGWIFFGFPFWLFSQIDSNPIDVLIVFAIFVSTFGLTLILSLSTLQVSTVPLPVFQLLFKSRFAKFKPTSFLSHWISKLQVGACVFLTLLNLFTWFRFFVFLVLNLCFSVCRVLKWFLYYEHFFWGFAFEFLLKFLSNLFRNWPKQLTLAPNDLPLNVFLLRMQIQKVGKCFAWSLWRFFKLLFSCLDLSHLFL